MRVKFFNKFALLQFKSNNCRTTLHKGAMCVKISRTNIVISFTVLILRQI